MLAWEKLQADFYTLANDILENLMLQRHGYKTAFYYAFNNDLEFLTCAGTDIEQTKILHQFADKNMLEFENKQPPSDLPKDFFSRNALDRNKKELTYLKIDPFIFDECYGQFKKYKANKIEPVMQKDTSVRLHKDDTRLIMRGSSQSEGCTLKEFRRDQIPDQLFTYLINQAPDQVVRIEDLKDAGIRTSSKLNDIVNKSLKPLARKTFVIVNRPDRLQVLTARVIGRKELELIVAEAESEK